MSELLVAKKGYTLTVVSWENDGDSYNTRKVVLDTKEEAVKMARFCMEMSNIIGNAYDQRDVNDILKFYVEHPQYADFEGDLKTKFDLFKSDFENDTANGGYNEDELEERVTDWSAEVMSDYVGYSEYYKSRVVESVTISYSEHDIYCEQIKF